LDPFGTPKFGTIFGLVYLTDYCDTVCSIFQYILHIYINLQLIIYIFTLFFNNISYLQNPKKVIEFGKVLHFGGHVMYKFIKMGPIPSVF